MCVYICIYICMYVCLYTFVSLCISGPNVFVVCYSEWCVCLLCTAVSGVIAFSCL